MAEIQITRGEQEALLAQRIAGSSSPTRAAAAIVGYEHTTSKNEKA